MFDWLCPFPKIRAFAMNFWRRCRINAGGHKKTGNLTAFASLYYAPYIQSTGDTLAFSALISCALKFNLPETP